MRRRDLTFGLALAAVLSLLLVAAVVTVTRVRFLTDPDGSGALLAAVPDTRPCTGETIVLTDPRTRRPTVAEVTATGPDGLHVAGLVVDPAGSALYRVSNVVPHGADPLVWFGAALLLPPLLLLMVAVALAGHSRRRAPEPESLRIMTPAESNLPDTAEPLPR